MGTRLRVESRSAAFIGMTNSAMVVTRPAQQLGVHRAADSRAFASLVVVHTQKECSCLLR